MNRSPIASPLRAAQALYAFATIARDPSRLGMVFELRDSMSSPEVMRPLAEHVRRTETGAAALARRERLSFDLVELGRLPVGTLGRAFAEHLRVNELDPSALPTLPSPDELEFLSAHLYETHDVWHAVTGFGADVAGELGLQAFYFAQLPGPLPAALLSAGLLNTFLRAMDDRERRMDAIARGWEMGKRARPLFGVRWERLWSTPLDEVRRDLAIDAIGAVAEA